MGDEVTKRTQRALVDGIARVKGLLDDSVEREKQKNDFLTGVPAIVDAITSGKIKCRVYIKKKFHAKAYITHSKLAVVGSSALVGSSNFTFPGLTGNVELIRQFAPYYNGMTSQDLVDKGQPETRVLIATDVLSEGLNLQDATRLINYDLHWNPVRLMQRIGRVDRRMSPEIEKKLIKDHPDVKAIRGTVEYWNFLPPGELDELLNLFKKVSNKTLLISKTLGIEGKKLLRPDVDFAALKDFDHAYEGEPTALETMHLEYQRLLAAHPDLPARLEALPGRVFSGKAHIQLGTQAVFFCFGLPGKDNTVTDAANDADAWTLAAGRTEWLLLELPSGKVLEDAVIHCEPETPRRCQIAQPTLSEARAKVEKHLKNGYFRQVQAPIGIAPELIAWMELN